MGDRLTRQQYQEIKRTIHALTRIATALERITDALETLAKAVEQSREDETSI